MLKRVLTIAIIMTGSVLLANAQTKDDFTPKKGDKSVSLNLGVGSFVGMEAPAPDLSTYNISAPQTSWFDKQLSLNFEFRWMFAKKWALKAMGGFSFKHNPEYKALPGNSTDGKFETGDIPDYNFVTSKDKIDVYKRQHQNRSGNDTQVHDLEQVIFNFVLSIFNSI